MEYFEKWWDSRPVVLWGMVDKDTAYKIWQAATERAAGIADDQNFEGHVDCEGCRTARLIADGIRKG